MNQLVKLSLITSAMALLTACGGSESGNPSSPNTPQPIPIDKNGELLSKASAYTVTSTATPQGKCTGRTQHGNTFQSDHLFIESISAGITEQELVQAAQFAEVALAELLQQTGLNADSDLHLDTAPWTLCIKLPDNGHSGSAEHKLWEQQLDSDPSDIYRLAKHEMTHLAGFEFYGADSGSNVYKWFNEALAVMIAQPDYKLPSRELDTYANDAGVSPLTIIDYNDENTLKANYENPYNVYVTTLAALSDKFNISYRDWFNVYVESQNSDFITAFDTLMSNKGASGITHSYLAILANWQSEVTDYVQTNMENTAQVMGDQDISFVYIEGNEYLHSGVSAYIGRSDTPANSGDIYFHGDTISDGVHAVYTDAEIGGKWYIIGPVNVEFSNGSVKGNEYIDFTGAPMEEDDGN